MNLVSLKTELRQELKLTPQLLQSMEVLQMNAQELLEYLDRVSEENPLVEQEADPDLQRAYEALCQKARWLDAGPPAGALCPTAERGAPDRETESLAAFLCDQLERQQLPGPLLALSKYIAHLVDGDGYLAQEDLDALSELNIPLVLMEQALTTVQSLEPAGVGARDLSECLLLQLSRQQDVSPALLDIAARFLPELGRRHYGSIARSLGLTPEEVRAAEARIAALDPHPGRAFQAAEPTVYIRPDVFIAELDGQLQVVLNEYYLPRVTISDYYVRLLASSPEPETREYLRQKLRQAKWLLQSLDRRGVTLRRCAEAVLEAQRPFFTGETALLAPMSLSSLAEALGVHLSTVSRATGGKYLQCRQGTFPLRYFFSRSLGSHGPSQQAVKQQLLAFIRQEDPCHPLSDQKLSELFAQQNIPLARRTVAKYRTELGIRSSTARKRP